jgi:acetylornithine/N-succinyldiaminopimelate aminotransferase
LIEGVQGEGGVTPATPEYLLGLRAVVRREKTAAAHGRRAMRPLPHRQIPEFPADSRKRSRRRKIPARRPFDGQVARRRFPIGAFWVRAPYADLLGAGTHATTFGGTPLACAVALKILEVIEQEKLADNARKLGANG